MRLGVAERVQMVGFREDIPAVMAALDVLILGSDYEGLGLELKQWREGNLSGDASQRVRRLW